MYKITDEFFRSSGPLTAPRAGPGHNNSSSPPFSSASSSSFPTSFAARTAPFEEANFGKGPAPMTEGCQKVIAASEKLTRVAEKLNNVGPDKFFRRYFPRNYGRVVSTWEAVEGKVNALWDGLGLGKGGWLGSRIKGDSGADRSAKGVRLATSSMPGAGALMAVPFGSATEVGATAAGVAASDFL